MHFSYLELEGGPGAFGVQLDRRCQGTGKGGGLVLYDLTLAEAAEVESYNVSLHSFQRC